MPVFIITVSPDRLPCTSAPVANNTGLWALEMFSKYVLIKFILLYSTGIVMSLCLSLYTPIAFLIKLLWPDPPFIPEGYLLISGNKSFWSFRFGETSLLINLPKRTAYDSPDHRNRCHPSLLCPQTHTPTSLHQHTVTSQCMCFFSFFNGLLKYYKAVHHWVSGSWKLN